MKCFVAEPEAVRREADQAREKDLGNCLNEGAMDSV